MVLKDALGGSDAISPSRSFITVWKAVRSQPGSNWKRSRKFDSWKVGAFGAVAIVVLILAVILITYPAALSQPSFFLFCFAGTVAIIVSGFLTSIIPPFVLVFVRPILNSRYILLCEPGRAILTLTIAGTNSDGETLVKSGNFAATERDQGYGKALMHRTLDRMDAIGSIRKSGRAQTLKVGQYYVREFGFDLDETTLGITYPSLTGNTRTSPN